MTSKDSREQGEMRSNAYRMEGNFGSGKIWRIHCMNTLVEENLANCEILQVKIS